MAERDRAGRRRYFIPKTMIQGWRDAWYRQAFEAAQERDPDLKYSDWIRGALDRRAKRDAPVDRPELLEPVR